MTKLLNLDGLTGPNHNYAGLALGNLASKQHQGESSSPRAAALQGLEKMWRLHQLGIPQGIIPPQTRPDLALLYAAGFRGSPEQLLQQAWKRAPRLLEACYSASAMWAANSATVTASVDSQDARLQLTPANLISSLHRSRESADNGLFFRRCFASSNYFHHHPPLPAQASFADEGAANHCRLSDPNSDQALNLFIYGREESAEHTARYPARQSRLACESILRSHQLKGGRSLLIRQNPEAINHGAFHNDVVAVGFRNLLLLHQQAFASQPDLLGEIRKACQTWQSPLYIFEVSNDELTLDEAVSSYLFNAQLVPISENEIMMLAPEECREHPKALQVCQRILDEDNPVSDIEFIDLRQSMNNGGGPACLRLAIPITEQELTQVHPGIMMSEPLYSELQLWICAHYRDRLTREALLDPQLISEIETALESLSKLLKLPGLYDH